MSRRRFAINPGPLRLTGPRVTEDHDAGRCAAIQRDGLRCIHDAKYSVKRDGMEILVCGKHVQSVGKKVGAEVEEL